MRQFLADKIQQNDIKKQQAKDDGNQALLIGLMLVGGFLMMSHAAVSMPHSLKGLFRRLSKNISSEEAREIGPHIIREEDNER